MPAFLETSKVMSLRSLANEKKKISYLNFITIYME